MPQAIKNIESNLVKYSATASDSKHTIDQLFRESLKYRGSEQFKRFFTFIAKFNHYSRYNSMLVFIQNPAVTFFGSTYFWKTKFGRRIKENARPLIILAPMGPVILAFDVYDTVGVKPPKEFLESGGNKFFEVSGEFREEYLTALSEFATKHKIKIQVIPLNHYNAGAVTTYITKKLEIYLREGNSQAQHFGTLCHELAHVLLGHTGHRVLEARASAAKKITLPERTKLTMKQEELEAETVSFLICKRYGLQTQSMEYLAGYIQSDKDWENFSYEGVVKVTDKLERIIGRKI